MFFEPLRKLRPYIVGMTKKPSEMTRAEAQADFEEFMTRKAELLAYFEGVLRQNKVLLTGNPEEDLTLAGNWLASKGRQRKDDLSVPTMSACCYLGLMLGDRLLQNCPGTAWILVTDHKRDIDYHRPVIRPANNRTQIEPINVAMNLIRGQLRGSRPPTAFADVYRLWRDALSPRPATD